MRPQEGVAVVRVDEDLHRAAHAELELEPRWGWRRHWLLRRGCTARGSHGGESLRLEAGGKSRRKCLHGWW